jgi:hypothetical protein
VSKESVPQLPRGSFDADALLRRMLCGIFAVGVTCQIVLASQAGNECLIGIRFRPAQFVIEMNNREHDAQFAPQFQQQPQERNRIDPARNRQPNAVPRLQQVLAPNPRKHALRQ